MPNTPKPTARSTITLQPHLRLLVVALLGCLLLLAGLHAQAADEAPEPATQGPAKSLTADEERVRQILLDILQDSPEGQARTSAPAQDSAGSDVFSYDAGELQTWQNDTMANGLASNLRRVYEKVPSLWQDTKTTFLLTTDAAAGYTWQKVVLTIALACALGLLFEYLTTRKLLQLLHRYVDRRKKTISLKVRYLFLRTIIQILGFMALFVAGYSCELMNLYGNSYYESLHTQVLKALIWFRVSVTVCANVFSPQHKVLRVVNLDCDAASRLYRFIVGFLLVLLVGNTVVMYLFEADFDRHSLTALLIPYALTLNAMLIVGSWVFKREIDQMFLDPEGAPNHDDMLKRQGLTVQVIAHIWPALFAAWLLAILGAWLFNVALGNEVAAKAVSIAWWITLVFPILDRVTHAALKNFSHVTWLQSPHFEERSRVFRSVLQYSFRAIAIATAILVTLYAWGFKADELGSMGMARAQLIHLVDLALAVLLVYTGWTIMSAYFESKLPAEETALASLEGDAGGSGATRSETLLPVVRSVLNVLFAIFLVLTVLHTMGVSIAPVLAGAGVVGIALGFGAQKLVQDVLSGMFFLIDDAFRRGEYIEIENLRGTVEQISLRSMQLRHHLGAVQTIPYGEIKTVRNLSRDWVTMKLELRLPYETDIEKVRKIIKKTGQKMLEHEEWGKHFILPLKSQGVFRVDDSALIVRMKFTSIPGEQWILRREAYRLVRDALEAQGIQFARREVRVLLPEAPAQAPDKASAEPPGGGGLAAAGGAAAMAALAAEAAAHANRDNAGSGEDSDAL